MIMAVMKINILVAANMERIMAKKARGNGRELSQRNSTKL